MKQYGILVAPSEPPSLRAIGKTSSIPERFGSDVYVPALRLGIQRKEVKDLVASAVGERLPKEMLQMKRLLQRFLIVEGRFNFTADGEWVNGFQRFTREQYRGLLYSVMEMGVKVVTTDDLRDTINEVRHVIKWASKEHRSLETRPKTLVSRWGTREDADWRRWAYQGWPGIGPTQATAIDKFYDGEFQLHWKSPDTLIKVPGLGKTRVANLLRGTGRNGVHEDAVKVIEHEAEFLAGKMKGAWRNHAQVIVDAVRKLRT